MSLVNLPDRPDNVLFIFREVLGSGRLIWKNGPIAITREHRVAALARSYLRSAPKRSRSEETSDIIYRVGHHLEWLAEYLSLDEMEAEDMQEVILALVVALEERRPFNWEDRGELCHALRAVALCRERLADRQGSHGAVDRR